MFTITASTTTPGFVVRRRNQGRQGQRVLRLLGLPCKGDSEEVPVATNWTVQVHPGKATRKHSKTSDWGHREGTVVVGYGR